MPPVIAPMVHVNVLGILDVNAIFTLLPLQAFAVVELVIIGTGITVTVIVKGDPAQEPVVAVGVTMY